MKLDTGKKAFFDMGHSFFVVDCVDETSDVHYPPAFVSEILFRDGFVRVMLLHTVRHG